MKEKIKEHLNKNNSHHAYLIEGRREDALGAIFDFTGNLGISVLGNPDFMHISVDTFKMEHARELKSKISEKSISGGKKVFLLSANNFLLEAQNALLKIFEEPTGDTLFFLVIPDANILLPTVFSRFYFIGGKNKDPNETKEAEKFVMMSPSGRIEFLKELLVDNEETPEANSPRSRAMKFLNEVEEILHDKIFNRKIDTHPEIKVFEQIFSVREFLRQPGSSTKSLMESIALVMPKNI